MKLVKSIIWPEKRQSRIGKFIDKIWLVRWILDTGSQLGCYLGVWLLDLHQGNILNNILNSLNTGNIKIINSIINLFTMNTTLNIMMRKAWISGENFFKNNFLLKASAFIVWGLIHLQLFLQYFFLLNIQLVFRTMTITTMFNRSSIIETSLRS